VQAARWARQRDPSQRQRIVAERAGRMQQQKFRSTPGGYAPPKQARGDHARLVQYERVTRPQKRWEVAESPMLDAATV
jgi:hypothetical protein